MTARNANYFQFPFGLSFKLFEMMPGKKKTREVDLSDFDLGKIEALDPSFNSGDQKVGS